MSVLERRVEGQVQFWSLLGPFLILLAVAIVLFKMSGHWYLSTGVLVGVPLCVKWKMNGLAIALTFLFGLFFLSYHRIDFGDRYWHLGMGMALALSFVILTLSLEEIKTLIDTVLAESQSRLDNFLRLAEDVKLSEQAWSTEKEAFLSRIGELAKELARSEEERLAFQKLVYLAKDELISLRGQHELLVEDLVYKKQKIAELNERFDENEMTIQTFVNSEPSKEIKKLSMELEECRVQAIADKAMLTRLENELASVTSRYAEKEQELAEKLQEESVLQDKIIGFVNDSASLRKQLQDNNAAILRLSDEKETLSSSVAAMLQEQENLRSSESLQKNRANELEDTLHALHRAIEEQKEEFATCSSTEKAKHLLLQAELHQRQENLQKLEEELRQLRVSYENLQAEEDNLRKSLAVRSELNDAGSTEFGISDTIRIETMYKQLKEQFLEKNAYLVASRKELFLSGEQILALRKERDDLLYFNRNDSETALLKELDRAVREGESIRRQSRAEIDELYELVGSLLKQIPDFNVSTR